MTFGTAIRTCLWKYATFRGRAPRSEYWWFFLFLLLGTIAIGIIDATLFGSETVQVAPGEVSVDSNGPLAGLFNLAMILPMLAVGWRRMHDTGRSGLYLIYPVIAAVGIGSALGFFGALDPATRELGDQLAIIILIPAAIILMISPLLVIWWLTRPTQPGTNPYGPPPNPDPRPQEVQQ